MSSDYYTMLGVNKQASQQEIKNAYRTLAKQYHPDKNPGNKEAEQKFKDINNAYDILKDEQKRAAYDRYGESAFNGSMGGGGHGGFDFSGSGASFADIFEDLFSGGMGGQRQQQARPNMRGADQRYNLEITLEEAYHGQKKEIHIPNTHVACEDCHGSGSSESGGTTNCEMCDGMGRVRMQQGFFTLERTCAACQGTGQVIKNPCDTCRGNGRVRKARKLSVTIPAGVEEGTRMRLAGEGEAGMRGDGAGDLYIFISVKPHELFLREGMDIHCHVPIPFTTAALGGSVEVPTIAGSRAKVTIPAGTQSSHQFRLRGKGMPLMRNKQQHGDMYVHVDVEVPVKLSKEQKALLEQFTTASNAKSSPETESFTKKVKAFLKQYTTD